MFPIWTLWKHQKIFDFLVFSGDIKSKHSPEMGQTRLTVLAGDQNNADLLRILFFFKSSMIVFSEDKT